MREAEKKIVERSDLAAECARLRAAGQKIVFTNGCFDLVHAGHATYLQFARAQGDVLVVGLNTDASVRRYKGAQRPLVDEQNRARMMAALECVDYVTFFDEDEPKALIAKLQPDVLVKAEDWAHYVSGRDVVEARGGKVVLAPMVAGPLHDEADRQDRGSLRQGVGTDRRGESIGTNSAYVVSNGTATTSTTNGTDCVGPWWVPTSPGTSLQ
jgi:D-glycero-beta-D-manno-heptose 1-phosphate adenylyltransferase